MTTITTTDLLTYNHIYRWAESLPDTWTARPGSCIECPIAQYLNDVAASAQDWIVGTDAAVLDMDSNQFGSIYWAAFMHATFNARRKARLKRFSMYLKLERAVDKMRNANVKDYWSLSSADQTNLLKNR